MRRSLTWLLSITLLLSLAPAQAALPAKGSLGNPLPSLASLVDRVSPAVVNIATFSAPASDKGQLRRSKTAGSGVIINSDQGLILSNHHVITAAENIRIALVDGRTFSATLLGSDPGADLALLKIEADKLTALPLADSDRLRVGDFVLAIGNPFGLGQTVTSGIVSALGRTGLGIEHYENFIQTDAAINPGNSGGALINLRGELIGINTAIMAPKGGNSGIGFAIPSNMAKTISSHLAEDGEARRGNLGVSVQDLSPDLAEAFHLPEGERGVLVSHVKAGSAAAAAGIRPGDVIVAINDRPINSVTDLRTKLGVLTLSNSLTIRLLRGGQRIDLVATLDAPHAVEIDAKALHVLLAGVVIDGGNKEVRVLRVAAGSPAAQGGLRANDRVLTANRKPVRSLAEFQAVMVENTGSLLLLVNRRGGPHYLVIN
tara:strand:+ start:23549 stop:24838 length:1290 start_codon:yes stop_codon:yes gene_type:complete